MRRKTKTSAVLSAAVESGMMQIEPLKQPLDLTDATRFVKVDSDSGFKMHLSALASQIPNAAAASAMSGMYFVRFPKGVNGVLTKLGQGGYSTVLKGPNGRFSGSASLYQASSLATVYGAFTVMAAVSQQYFLVQINKELKLINQGIERILDFLYGDKKAELISEISFIKRAIRDYASVMEYETQQTAMLTGIIQAEKVAMKDIEFYLQDLERTVEPTPDGSSDVEKVMNSSKRLCDSLNASLQLYCMACILEVYYSHDINQAFIDDLKKDMFMYVNRCYREMTRNLSNFKGKVQAYTAVFDKIDKETYVKSLNEMIESLNEKKMTELQASLSNALDAVTKATAFVVTDDNEVYCKING